MKLGTNISGLRVACIACLVLTVLFFVQATELDTNGQRERINIGIIFTKTAGNENLQEKFKLCIFSILKYATVDMNIYIIGDRESQNLARRIISRVRETKIDYKVFKLINRSEYILFDNLES